MKFFGICFCLLCIMSCEDMNSISQEYFDRGETFYTGKIRSLQSLSGNNRVKFLWTVNSDPRITKTVIYWNEGMDSTTVAVNRTQPDSVQLEKVIELPERNYLFEFVTKDDAGHRSLSVERSVTVYGEKYTASLPNRDVVSAVYHDDGQLVIQWNTVASNYCVGNNLNYTNTANQQITRYVPATEETTVIPDWKTGLSYYTRFAGDIYLDTLDTAAKNLNVIESMPFNGPHILSADNPCIIEARDFDYGGEGLAYHDVDPTNEPSPYRTAKGDDISRVTIESGINNVGSIRLEEWLVYTVEVRDAGVYAADMNASVNSYCDFYLSVDGKKCETVQVPANGSYYNWLWVFETYPQLTQPELRLSAGKHKIRFSVAERRGFNLMSFKFTYIGE
ncbi:MAG: carbohydrate-binding protein [Tannerella sp.]|nr:carbohydrate-binding protein [Tannerella sp.]